MVDRAVLFAKWNGLADWLFALMKDGHEGAVLEHLARQPEAAEAIVRTAFASDDYTQRKLAACLAGYLQTEHTGLLDELFEAEAARDRRAPSDDFDRFLCQSVVEDIVFAASRWCRREPQRDAALKLLHKVVEQTIAGQYWNTSSYAIVTLCRYDAAGSDGLLRRFESYARTQKIEHPSRPTLQQERDFAENLIKRNQNTLDAIENLLRDKDAIAAAARFDPESHRAVADLIAAAGGSYTIPTASPEPPTQPKRGFWGKLFGG